MFSLGRATGPKTHDGALQQHDQVRVGLQHLGEDHRTHPVQMRHAQILEVDISYGNNLNFLTQIFFDVLYSR